MAKKKKEFKSEAFGYCPRCNRMGVLRVGGFVECPFCPALFKHSYSRGYRHVEKTARENDQLASPGEPRHDRPHGPDTGRNQETE